MKHTQTALWQPSQERIEQAGITRFSQWIDQQGLGTFSDYHQLWEWSVAEPEAFWTAVARYYRVFSPSQLQAIECGNIPVKTDSSMHQTRWFPGVTLNMAEYLLRQGDLGDLQRAAVLADSEIFPKRELSWQQLRQQVVQLAAYLRQQGVEPGDRVVAYLPASIESIVAVLACISVGAIWSSCSPDFGSRSVLERFSQIRPKLLITVTAYQYNGQQHDRRGEVEDIVSNLDSLDSIIHLPWLDHQQPQPPQTSIPCVSWQQALDTEAEYDGFEFEPVDFNHPLWIMYTSGTTGMPKGIVHSQGGVLLELVKFAWLHDDLTPESVKFFFTTTGWAMFNMLLGGLASGSAIVLYDGCPTYPDQHRLWRMSESFGVTYFGVSPTYFNGLMKTAYSPREHFDLSRIQTIASGGSPVSPENFQWFYQSIHSDLHVVSMSGGTDVATAFVGGVPTLPVYAGRIQAPCLGVAAKGYDENAKEVVGADAELVITEPMPSMPLYFWNDDQGQRYFDSYFDHFDGVWRQGDQVEFFADQSCCIHGRSDSTLNRFGVRIGTAEIYRTVESIEGIRDSLIVNLELPGGEFFMPLFVVVDESLACDTGQELPDELTKQIRSQLSQNCSPRHVPEKIYVINAVPYTLSGKKQEVPVKKLLSGTPVNKAVNLDACANPESIHFFVEFAQQLAKKFS